MDTKMMERGRLSRSVLERKMMRGFFIKLAVPAILLAGLGPIPAAFAQTTDNAMQHPAMTAPTKTKDGAMSHEAMSHKNSMDHGMHMNSMSHESAMQHDEAMKNSKPQ